MDGIKFEQGAIKTESRSSCADAGDFCGSMGCSYFPGMNAKAQAIFICRFVGESWEKQGAHRAAAKPQKREQKSSHKGPARQSRNQSRT
jgi:hypothetical protein